MRKADPLQAPLVDRALSEDQRLALVAEASQSGPDGARAAYLLGLNEAAQSRWPRAGEYFKQTMQVPASGGWEKPAQFKAAQALEKMGDGARAFVQYQGLVTTGGPPPLVFLAREACLRLSQSLDSDSLRRLLQGYASPEFDAPLRLRSLELDLAAGRKDEARLGVDEFLRRHPQGPGMERVQSVSRALEASVEVDKGAVGLMLPQAGGALGAFALQVRHGIELALAAANQGRLEGEQLRLVDLDEAQPKASLEKAAREQKIIGVLGPLSSDAAKTLIPELSVQRLPLLSPSAARPDLAEASPWFFRNTLSLNAQAQAVAEHLVKARGLTRVASLSSDNAYGQALSQAFAQKVSELGGVVVQAASYKPGMGDFKAAFLQLGGVDPGVAKNAEADEKRSQQARVEEASTALGRYLLSPAARVALTGTAEEEPTTVTAKLRVLTVDFAQDTTTAAMSAGRSFAERFARTLGQLEDLEVLAPPAAERLVEERSWNTDLLSMAQLIELGRAASADYVLSGGTLEDATPNSPAAHRRYFSLAAQLVDCKRGEIVSQQRFNWSKYQAPNSNALGLQAIYLPASGEDVAQVIPAMTFFDLKLPLAGSDQWDRPAMREQLTALEGAVFSAPFWPEATGSTVKAFNQAYRRTYAERPSLLAAQAYDAASMLFKVLRQGAATRVDLRAGLAATRGFDGACGATSFNGRQDAEKRPILIRIQGGALRPISE